MESTLILRKTRPFHSFLRREGKSGKGRRPFERKHGHQSPRSPVWAMSSSGSSGTETEPAKALRLEVKGGPARIRFRSLNGLHSPHGQKPKRPARRNEGAAPKKGERTKTFLQRSRPGRRELGKQGSPHRTSESCTAERRHWKRGEKRRDWAKNLLHSETRCCSENHEARSCLQVELGGERRSPGKERVRGCWKGWRKHVIICHNNARRRSLVGIKIKEGPGELREAPPLTKRKSSLRSNRPRKQKPK